MRTQSERNTDPGTHPGGALDTPCALDNSCALDASCALDIPRALDISCAPDLHIPAPSPSAPNPLRFVAFAAMLTVLIALLCCSLASAQGRPGGGGPGGPGGGGPGVGGPGVGGPGGRSGFPADPHGGGPNSPNNSAGISGNRGALRGPAGRWWDESHYANSVGLTGDQQRRMDSVFAENRSALVSNLDNLKSAQSRLDALSHTDHPSEAALLDQIQNVNQARADLEKANTHMLLQIRNEMTADQINKLEKLK